MPPREGPPQYRQIADTLRQQILSGALSAGAMMDSEPTLAKAYKVSTQTIRRSLEVLRAEGLVVTEQGRGTQVRPQIPMRRIAGNRYRQHDAETRSTPFTRDHKLEFEDPPPDMQFTEVGADPDVAELFGAPVGTPVLRRRFIFSAHGFPQQMSYSYLPLDLVQGTPVADPANEPWPGGTIAQLDSLGVTVTAVEESVRARMPLAEEAELLRIPGGVPVLTITRRMLSGDRAVEVAADIVIPGDRVVLDFRIDL